MDENLVGYLLDALEPEQQRDVETRLKSDPAAQQKLEVLRRALEPLAADKEGPEPPSGLIFRTLGRVAEYRCRPQPEVRPAPPTVDVHGGRPWYRRADLLIAASLLIVVGGVGVPGVVKLRGDHQKALCKDTMNVVYKGLEQYSDANQGRFPTVQERPPLDRAGSFVPVLLQAGVLPADINLGCPANGKPRPAPYTLKDLEAMTPAQFEEAARDLSGCYAYTLGYHDGEGQHQAHRRGGTDLNDSRIPILADRPARHGAGRNSSSNHNGQNILYIDGHVEFHKNPTVDGDHIFLNRHNKVGAGVNQWDTVLGCSEDKP